MLKIPRRIVSLLYCQSPLFFESKVNVTIYCRSAPSEIKTCIKTCYKRIKTSYKCIKICFKHVLKQVLKYVIKHTLKHVLKQALNMSFIPYPTYVVSLLPLPTPSPYDAETTVATATFI